MATTSSIIPKSSPMLMIMVLVLVLVVLHTPGVKGQGLSISADLGVGSISLFPTSGRQANMSDPCEKNCGDAQSICELECGIVRDIVNGPCFDHCIEVSGSCLEQCDAMRMPRCRANCIQSQFDCLKFNCSDLADMEVQSVCNSDCLNSVTPCFGRCNNGTILTPETCQGKCENDLVSCTGTLGCGDRIRCIEDCTRTFSSCSRGCNETVLAGLVDGILA